MLDDCIFFLCHLHILLGFVENVHGTACFCRFKEKPYGSSGATSGLSSSLAFTPVQVCVNPIFEFLLTDPELFLLIEAFMKF